MGQVMERVLGSRSATLYTVVPDCFEFRQILHLSRFPGLPRLTRFDFSLFIVRRDKGFDAVDTLG